MNFIKINKESIKKNPRAGATESHARLPITISFEIQCPLPESLKNVPGIIIAGWSDNGAYGYLDNETLISKLEEAKVPFSWELDSPVQTFRHKPEPDYLYEYENSPVQCSECKSIILLSEVKEGENDGSYWEICPKCDAVDSFDIEHEDIEDAIKNL